MNSCIQLKEINVSFQNPPSGSTYAPCFAYRSYLIASKNNARWVRKGLALCSELRASQHSTHALAGQSERHESPGLSLYKHHG